MTEVHLVLLLSLVLFGAGLYVVITRPQAILALVGLELMLNAANINFVLFATAEQGPDGAAAVDGWMMVVFVLVLAAVEAAIGLALIMQLYKAYGTTDLNHVRRIREKA